MAEHLVFVASLIFMRTDGCAPCRLTNLAALFHLTRIRHEERHASRPDERINHRDTSR